MGTIENCDLSLHLFIVLCKPSRLPLLHHCNRPSTHVEGEFPIPWVEYLWFVLADLAVCKAGAQGTG